MQNYNLFFCIILTFGRKCELKVSILGFFVKRKISVARHGLDFDTAKQFFNSYSVRLFGLKCASISKAPLKPYKTNLLHLITLLKSDLFRMRLKMYLFYGLNQFVLFDSISQHIFSNWNSKERNSLNNNIDYSTTLLKYFGYIHIYLTFAFILIINNLKYRLRI